MKYCYFTSFFQIMESKNTQESESSNIKYSKRIEYVDQSIVDRHERDKEKIQDWIHQDLSKLKNEIQSELGITKLQELTKDQAINQLSQLESEFGWKKWNFTTLNHPDAIKVVFLLQRVLSNTKYDCKTIDGIYKSWWNTHNALLNFQKENGCTMIDWIPWPETVSKVIEWSRWKLDPAGESQKTKIDVSKINKNVEVKPWEDINFSQLLNSKENGFKIDKIMPLDKDFFIESNGTIKIKEWKKGESKVKLILSQDGKEDTEVIVTVKAKAEQVVENTEDMKQKIEKFNSTLDKLNNIIKSIGIKYTIFQPKLQESAKIEDIKNGEQKLNSGYDKVINGLITYSNGDKTVAEKINALEQDKWSIYEKTDKLFDIFKSIKPNPKAETTQPTDNSQIQNQREQSPEVKFKIWTVEINVKDWKAYKKDGKEFEHVENSNMYYSGEVGKIFKIENNKVVELENISNDAKSRSLSFYREKQTDRIFVLNNWKEIDIKPDEKGIYAIPGTVGFSGNPYTEYYKKEGNKFVECTTTGETEKNYLKNFKIEFIEAFSKIWINATIEINEKIIPFRNKSIIDLRLLMPSDKLPDWGFEFKGSIIIKNDRVAIIDEKGKEFQLIETVNFIKNKLQKSSDSIGGQNLESLKTKAWDLGVTIEEQKLSTWATQYKLSLKNSDGEVYLPETVSNDNLSTKLSEYIKIGERIKQAKEGIWKSLSDNKDFLRWYWIDISWKTWFKVNNTIMSANIGGETYKPSEEANLDHIEANNLMYQNIRFEKINDSKFKMTSEQIDLKTGNKESPETITVEITRDAKNELPKEEKTQNEEDTEWERKIKAEMDRILDNVMKEYDLKSIYVKGNGMYRGIWTEALNLSSMEGINDKEILSLMSQNGIIYDSEYSKWQLLSSNLSIFVKTKDGNVFKVRESIKLHLGNTEQFKQQLNNVLSKHIVQVAK